MKKRNSIGGISPLDWECAPDGNIWRSQSGSEIIKEYLSLGYLKIRGKTWTIFYSRQERCFEIETLSNSLIQ